MRDLRSHVTYANTISSLALFIALSSGAYAAGVLPKNSVGAGQIQADAVGASELKDNAVTSATVKNGSLGQQDLSPAALKALSSAGPAGAAGAKGDAGAPGSAGPAGAAGGSGTPGLDGAVGASGQRGATGATGVTGPTGGTGAASDRPGPTGAQGAAGTARAWAHVTSSGTVDESVSVIAGTEDTPAAGYTCLRVTALGSTKVAVATLDFAAADSAGTIGVTVDPTAVAAHCAPGDTAVVATRSPSGALVDYAYSVMFN